MVTVDSLGGMRCPTPHFLLFSLVVLSVSCGQPTTEPSTNVPAPAPVPDAFEEEGALESVSEIKSRGYNENAVDKLFAEVLEKDTALAGLLDRWTAQAPAHVEHLQAFHAFNANNQDYYVDADQKASTLADSLLEQGISRRLHASRERYEEVTVPFRRTIEQHRVITAEGNDLVTLIAVERTLDVVETYQRQNQPDRKVLDTDVAKLVALRDELRTKLKP